MRTMKFLLPFALLAGAAGLLANPASAPQASLRDAAQGRFLIGAAINKNVIFETDPASVAIVNKNFSAIAPENCMKWEWIHPTPKGYDFEIADRYVDFGTKHKLFILGHTLMWHYQIPDWVFKNEDGTEKTREQLLAELREHIRTVVGRYKGRVTGWDVVNEAAADNGGLNLDRPWYKILGEEGILEAFRVAHETDPDAELYYNDFCVWLPAKQKTVIELVAKIRAAGLRIDGVGLQEHITTASPSIAEMEGVLEAFERAKIPVMITELDMSVLPRPDNSTGADIARASANSAEYDPYRKGLPEAKQQELTDHYKALFELYRKHASNIKRINVWGVTDSDTWLDNWPIPGRRDYPLLFDRDHKPKPAYFAVIQALSQPSKASQ